MKILLVPTPRLLSRKFILQLLRKHSEFHVQSCGIGKISFYGYLEILWLSTAALPSWVRLRFSGAEIISCGRFGNSCEFQVHLFQKVSVCQFCGSSANINGVKCTPVQYLIIDIAAASVILWISASLLSSRH